MLNVVCGVLISDNKILLTKRSSKLKVMPNKYEFPGGKIENNESLKQGLKRELFEELSINVNCEDIIEFDNNILITEKFILNAFIIKKWKNNLIINPEINSEILEIDFNKLINIDDLLDTNKKLIPAILKYLHINNI
jgi:8-oxo-dGTP diphosphatase